MLLWSDEHPRSILWAKNAQWCHREAGVSEKRCDLRTGRGGGREEGDEQWEQWGGKRGGWDGNERGLRASAATAVMAQTRWRGEQWSEARGEAVVTLIQRHMSWQLVTTQPITQTQTKTHSHYPTHQISRTRYQHKGDKHIRINQHSLSTPSTIIRTMIISYTLSKMLITAIFIIILIFSLTINQNHIFLYLSIHASIYLSIYLWIHLSIHQIHLCLTHSICPFVYSSIYPYLTFKHLSQDS